MVSGVGNVQLMQRINRVQVLDTIRKNGPIARTELAKRTNLSPSSITNIINYLMEQNLVFQVGQVYSNSVGRKAALLEFNGAAMNIIAVNVEPHEAEIALTDLNGHMLFSSRLTIPNQTNSTQVLSLLEEKIRGILGEYDNVQAIGISVSGHVVGDQGIVISSIMRWKEVNVKNYFERAFGLHVYVTNNSKTKALWQINQYGGQVEKNVVFLDLSLGVGIISFNSGRINESVAGELGHTTIMKDGPQCFCGNRGCLELVCSPEYILSRCVKAAKDGLSPRLTPEASKDFDQVLAAFQAGDPIVYDIFRECAEYLGIGIANIISIFEPSLIIINENRLTKCDFIYQTALHEAEQRASSLFSRPVKYEKVNISNTQALEGVAQYVADRLFALDGPDHIL